MDATLTPPKHRLGKGLDALMGDPHTPAGRGDKVACDRIQNNPYQPRKQFGEDELAQLRDSIKSHGVLQPLVVRKVGDGYQLVAGERRLRAAQAAGLKDVPVHVVDFNDQQVYEAALVENIQRADLNAIEKARGFKDYLDRFTLTQDQLGTKLGIDRTSVSNLLGLLNLPPEVQDAVRLGQITMGHARVLKGIPDAARQVEVCKQVILSGMSVHALEQLTKEQKKEPTPAPAGDKTTTVVTKTAHVLGVETELKQRLAVRVEIKLKAKDKGQIVIGFESNDDFERVVGALQK
jgi:ParB family transcriptional regulator, chromosome partitioning protein